jgi:xylulokinase
MAGLTLGHTRNDIARAAFEGLVYELNALLSALEQSAGYPISRVIAVGGGSQSSFWTQLKADITGHPMMVSPQTEAVTLGAAMLAGLGSGIYSSLEDAQAAHALPGEMYTPDPARAQLYDRLYRLRIRRIRELCVSLGAATGRLWGGALDDPSPTRA